jgi:hypothetical protein
MDSYINVSALWHVALFGVLFGAGIVICYALGVIGASRVTVARQRGGAGVIAPAMLAAVSFATVATGLAFGLYVLLSK